MASSKRKRKRLRQAAARARYKDERGGRGSQRAERAKAKRIVGKARLDRITRRTMSEIGPGGGIRSGARAAAGSAVGRRLFNIARQRLSKLPGIGRFAKTTRRARAAQVPLVYGTRAVATRASTRAIAVRTAIPVAAGAGAAGVAWEAGRALTDVIPGIGEFMRRGKGRAPARRRTQAIPFTPGAVVPTDAITHTWIANGVPFAQLADGRVMVRRKNGTVKTFRRPRPIVLGRNPGVRDLVRADKKIDQLLKIVRKRLPARRTRAAAPERTTQIVRAG